jgi:hypothetical protein
MEEAAVLSDASYRPGEAPEGYSIDPRFSNRNRTLYVDNATGKATLAFRGTDLKNRADLGTDALLAMGLSSLSSRFRNAKRAARRAQAEYGDNLQLAGHSLGGSQALYASSRTGLAATALNPGVPPSFAKKSVLDRLGMTLFKKKVPSGHIYTTGSDPISALSPLTGVPTTRVKQKIRGDPHAIQNFLRGSPDAP